MNTRSTMSEYNGSLASRVRVTVPTGLACFPGEIGQPPKSFAEYKYPNIIQYSDLPRGGHFAALQEPQLLADDIRSFIKNLNKK